MKKTSRIAFSTPFVVDKVSGMFLQCFTIISVLQYLRCNVEYTNGSNVEASISYGDGTVDNYTVAGKLVNSLYLLGCFCFCTVY